jgi:hypothetical protein
MNYHEKYLKYKRKYLNLKNIIGGTIDNDIKRIKNEIKLKEYKISQTNSNYLNCKPKGKADFNFGEKECTDEEKTGLKQELDKLNKELEELKYRLKELNNSKELEELLKENAKLKKIVKPVDSDKLKNLNDSIESNKTRIITFINKEIELIKNSLFMLDNSIINNDNVNLDILDEIIKKLANDIKKPSKIDESNSQPQTKPKLQSKSQRLDDSKDRFKKMNNDNYQKLEKLQLLRFYRSKYLELKETLDKI